MNERGLRLFPLLSASGSELEVFGHMVVYDGAERRKSTLSSPSDHLSHAAHASPKKCIAHHNISFPWPPHNFGREVVAGSC